MLVRHNLRRASCAGPVREHLIIPPCLSLFFFTLVYLVKSVQLTFVSVNFVRSASHATQCAYVVLGSKVRSLPNGCAAHINKR